PTSISSRASTSLPDRRPTSRYCLRGRGWASAHRAKTFTLKRSRQKQHGPMPPAALSTGAANCRGRLTTPPTGVAVPDRGTIREASVGKLHHLAMSVPAPWRTAEFYKYAFGMEVVGEADSSLAEGVFLSDGVINLALLHFK